MIVQGYWHNQGLDYIISNKNNFTCDSNDLKGLIRQYVSDFACELKKVQVFGLGNDLIWESWENIPYGITNKQICVDRNDFNGAPTLMLRIKFIGMDNYKLCETSSIINACNDFPAPCIPDFLETDWSEPQSTSWQEVICPPNKVCQVKFTYRYRHVKDGNGNSIHRDIQVTNYQFKSGCDCPDEQIKEMLKYIWNNKKVIGGFGLYDIPDWADGDTKCFINFRVISTDCWETFNYQFGDNESIILKRKCYSDNCCYSTYQVCYKKIHNPPNPVEIILLENSITRLSTSDIIPEQCISPCVSNNCHTWRPDITDHREGTIDFENEKNMDNCKVFVIQIDDNNNYAVNLECNMNGKVEIQMVDLIGNIIWAKTQDKKSHLISIPIEKDLVTGSYFMRINIDNKLLYYNKINIIR